MINIDLYQHFSFDLWLTLIKSNGEFKLKRDQLFKEYFKLSNPIDQVRDSIRKYDLLCNKMSEITGKHIYRDEIFLIILNDLGIDIESISLQQLNEFCDLVDSLFENNPPQLLWLDIDILLNKIHKQNKTCSILSNTAFIHGRSLRKVLKDLNLIDYFSFTIFSDEMGLSKPNPLIFSEVFDRVSSLKQIKKEEILHIGDNPISDYQGAKLFGLAAKLIKN